MKAFLIARVSTEDQKDALPAQIYKLTDYAERNSFDYELIQFQESAYSGNREQIKLVIERIKAHPEKLAVVFDKIDRYTRDTSSEVVRTMTNLYKSGKITLHFPSDGLILHQYSSANDELRLGLGIVTSKYYSDAVSDNVRRRFDQMRRDGLWTGKAPFGYKNIDEPNGRKWIVADSLNASVVKDMFKLYASGTQSLKTVRLKIIELHGIKLAVSQIDRILKNPFYYGEMRVKGSLYPHNYDKVIDKELFIGAELVRNGYHVDKKRWAGLPYKYRGLIRCAECNSRITFEKKKQKYIYGHCTQFKGKHNASYVQEPEITNQFLKVFESLQIPEDAYQEVSQALKLSHEEKEKERQETEKHLRIEIEKYQNRIERIYDDRLDNKISEELYARKYEEFNESLRALQERQKNIELSQSKHYDSVFHLLNFMKDAPRLFKKALPEQKRSIINMTLSNLLLDKDLLRWELKKPFEITAFCNKTQNWLRVVAECRTLIITYNTVQATV